MSMRARWVVSVALLAIATTGCHRPEFIRKRSVAMDPPLVSADPALTDPAAGDPALGGTRNATFVDRHPLFRKPVEYYQSSGSNGAGKLARATFIGIPAGVLGEMRQIVVGCPPGF